MSRPPELSPALGRFLWYAGQTHWATWLAWPIRHLYRGLFPSIIGIGMPSGSCVRLRHSVLSGEFNPFTSDIDVTLVVPREADVEPALRCFLKKRRWLPMLDYPEIMTAAEAKKWVDYQARWGHLWNTIWKIRKTGWMLDRLKETTLPEERLKLERALSKGLAACTDRPEMGELLRLSDFPAFREFFPNDPTQAPKVCIYLPYLEVGRYGRPMLGLAQNEIAPFLEFFPGERATGEYSQDWWEGKRALTWHELCLARSENRLSKVLGRATITEPWVPYLESVWEELS